MLAGAQEILLPLFSSPREPFGRKQDDGALRNRTCSDSNSAKTKKCMLSNRPPKTSYGVGNQRCPNYRNFLWRYYQIQSKFRDWRFAHACVMKGVNSLLMTPYALCLDEKAAPFKVTKIAEGVPKNLHSHGLHFQPSGCGLRARLRTKDTEECYRFSRYPG